MKAIVVAPSAPARLALGQADSPTPDSNEILVRVHAVSLNRGEVRRAQSMPAGAQIGWDLAGVVEQAAADGSGPAAGRRVVGFSTRARGWAELVAVPSHSVATVPREVSLEVAATLPVAALTALYGLERGERLLGSKVLVTGVSGGVGYFGAQLARLMGAHVYAQVRNSEHEALAAETGASMVIVDETGDLLASHGPFRLVLDGVGGPMLGKLISALSEDGRAVLYGVTAGAETTLAIRDLMGTGTGRVDGFHLYREAEFAKAGEGLARVLSLVDAGRLKTLIGRTERWDRVGEVAAALLERSYPGKAVLVVD